MLEPFYFKKKKLFILDQSQLPNRLVYLKLNNHRELIKAIKELKVRGAPLLGIIAAYGVLQAMLSIKNELGDKLHKIIHQIKQSRPTAANLFWALEELEQIIALPLSDSEKKERIYKKVRELRKKEKENCVRLAKFSNKIIPNKATILTICNTGNLATPGIGTALGAIYYAIKKGKELKVYLCETRPLWQGARLSAFELLQNGIRPILITDGMVGRIMREVDLVLVGADRIARNGDTANKIGTLTLAITAYYYKKPFYVVAPSSTIDVKLQSGQEIPIEERSKEEVIKIGGRYIAPKEVEVFNPAFDVTPAELITAIITEKGIIYPPFSFTKVG